MRLTLSLVFLALLMMILGSLMVNLAQGSEQHMREVQASEVLDKISKGEPVQYDYVIIKGDWQLYGLGLPTKHVDRNENEINNYSLSENLTLVMSPIHIHNSIIEGATDLSNTVFFASVDFNDSSFNSPAGFRGSQFNSPVYFIGSKFNSRVNFVDSKFNSGAYFWKTKFNGHAYFDESKFNSTAYYRLSQFNGFASFSQSQFNGLANFDEAQFNSTTQFESAQFNSSAYFSSVKFNGPADFDGSKFFGLAYFWATRFDKEADFNDAYFNRTAFFPQTRFKDDAFFDGADFIGELYLTNAKFDRLYIQWCNITGRLAYDDTAYLLLSDNFKHLGYTEDYHCCYFQYRKEHRAQPWTAMGSMEEWIRKWFIDFPMEWLYGYGTKPLYPVGWSLVIIGFFGIFWRFAGLGTREWPPASQLKEGSLWWHALIFSLTVFLSGTKLFIDPPELPILQGRSKSLIKRAFIAERALGAFFSILLFLTMGEILAW
jgi:hypothetical protein